MTEERRNFGSETLEQGACGRKVGKRELPSEPVCGTIILDLDGTLTLPGSKYAIDRRAVLAVSEFVLRGGICALNTGATKERAERTFFNPLFCLIDEQCGNFDEAAKIFAERIWLLPENGSSILKSSGVTVLENELWFNWNETNPLHVPNKEKLRNLIETKLIPLVPGSFGVGDKAAEIGRRSYILSWKGLKDASKLVEMIKTEIIPENEDFDWEKIQMKAARTTIDFINAESGKEPSTRILLSKLPTTGPVVAFGDLGDEFARVPGVLTFNVNSLKPNSFRTVGLPSLEVTTWKVRDIGDCSPEEADNILCSTGGKPLRVRMSENGNLIPTQNNDGQKVILSEPLTKGAGEATAEILESLMDVGYFVRESD